MLKIIKNIKTLTHIPTRTCIQWYTEIKMHNATTVLPSCLQLKKLGYIFYTLWKSKTKRKNIFTL